MARTVVRAADFPAPRQITERDFEQICAVFKIPDARHGELRGWLDELTTGFDKLIFERSRERSRPDDRLNIDRALRQLKAARYWLGIEKGPAGQSAMRSTGCILGPMLSTAWLRERFPGDPETLAARFSWPEEDGRDKGRDALRPISVDRLSLDARIRFAEAWPALVFVAIVDELRVALGSTRDRIVQLPDGRSRLKSADTRWLAWPKAGIGSVDGRQPAARSSAHSARRFSTPSAGRPAE
jgi:hypothetical protein